MAHKLTALSLAASLASVAFATAVPLAAQAHWVPAPCDFITGGGFVFTDLLAKATFGSHGGCKHEAYWGHVNYVDHAGFVTVNGFVSPYHVESTEITAYLMDLTFPNARDICGVARTNAGETVRFRVRMVDNGEPGIADMFGIRLSNGYLVTTRLLGNGGPGGGNIQLHKPNPSTTAPPDNPGEEILCAALSTPDAGPPPPPPVE